MGAGAASDSRYEKASAASEAYADIHRGLQSLRLGQLQTQRALLAAELFNYDLRAAKLSDLERQRAQSIRNEIADLDRRIGTLEHAQEDSR